MPRYSADKTNKQKTRLQWLLKNAACSHFLWIVRCTSLSFMQLINIFSVCVFYTLEPKFTPFKFVLCMELTL